uniref:Piperideine synthase n=1 Tax=Flueggea suffruticosa TaxID=283120 RepID=A0AAU6W4J5_9ROSI
MASLSIASLSLSFVGYANNQTLRKRKETVLAQGRSNLEQVKPLPQELNINGTKATNLEQVKPLPQELNINGTKATNLEQVTPLAKELNINGKNGAVVTNGIRTNERTVVSKPHDLAQNPVTTTPFLSALKAAAEKNAASFHFPGHNRGHAAPPSLIDLIGLRPFMYDLTGLPDIDALSCPKGPILEAQQEAAKLFGASETWFLVGGTTCGVLAAIMGTCSPGDHIILTRNCHVSAISAMVLCGAVPKYMIPEYNSNWDVAGGITLSQVKEAIEELEMEGQKPAAIFITSPTFQGICSNIGEISRLCHSYGIPLIVDEAHGAHLGFHPDMPRSALSQGADLVVQSTHKVLPALSQSSMLHISGNFVSRDRISRCLQILQSTSANNLLLASLDAARAQLAENPIDIFEEPLDIAREARSLIKNIPHIGLLGLETFPKFEEMDPMRLTVGFWQLGLSGYEACEILERHQGVVPEMIGTKSITLPFNLGTRRDHVRRLAAGLEELSARSFQVAGMDKSVVTEGHEVFADVTVHLNPRDAFFAKKRTVSIRESLGKVCGELICPFPPGIPVMIPGEIITEKVLNYILDVKRKGIVVSGASDPLLTTIVICDV